MSHEAPRLQWLGAAAGLSQRRANDHLGFAKYRLGVADPLLPLGGHVRAQRLVHERGTGDGRGGDVGDGGQRRPVHADQVRRILSQVPVGRHHRGDGLADEPHPLGRQWLNPAWAREAGMLVEERQRRVGRAQIRARHHRHDAAGLGRRGRVDRQEAGVGVW